jgi:hypothetical protein
MALADTLTGPLPPIAFAAAVASPPFPPVFPPPAVPPVAVVVAETVPEAPGVVVVADALAAPPLPPRFPGPPSPPVALDRLELFPEASVVIVVADAHAGPPLPPFGTPLPPAPPVAKAEFVESDGLFRGRGGVLAVASVSSGRIRAVQRARDYRNNDRFGDRRGHRDKSDDRGRQKQLGFHCFSPQAGGDLADLDAGGRALCRHSRQEPGEVGNAAYTVFIGAIFHPFYDAVIIYATALDWPFHVEDR